MCVILCGQIDLLEMNDPLLREPYSKPLENGIKPDRERNKKSQPEYGEKTCTGIRDAIKTGICSDANKK